MTARSISRWFSSSTPATPCAQPTWSGGVKSRMRPWRGIDPVELPRVVFVLRSRADADGNELIGALEGHLPEILTSAAS